MVRGVLKKKRYSQNLCFKSRSREPDSQVGVGPNKKKLCGPLLWMGFNCLKATEPLRGGSLLFTTKFLEIPGTHLINLRRMKG